MLDDPIKKAAEGYMDFILVMRFEDDARAYLLEQLETRPKAGANVVVDQTRARANAIRLVQEAASAARARGADSVDLAAVHAAWIRLCPGLYPFC